MKLYFSRTSNKLPMCITFSPNGYPLMFNTKLTCKVYYYEQCIVFEKGELRWYVPLDCHKAYTVRTRLFFQIYVLSSSKNFLPD